MIPPNKNVQHLQEMAQALTKQAKALEKAINALAKDAGAKNRRSPTLKGCYKLYSDWISKQQSCGISEPSYREVYNALVAEKARSDSRKFDKLPAKLSTFKNYVARFKQLTP